MKKILLSLALLIAAVANVNAQAVWKMVVTHNDGTVDTLATSAVKDVKFISETKADLNVDQLIIKELYNGGTPKNEGTGYFQMDKGFILYNNCSQKIVVNNLAVGMVDPYNSYAMNGFLKDGKLLYADSTWVPAACAIWYFQEPLELEPYSQVVVSCMGAIDNTKTYSQSVNYANKDYYTMYDPESGFTQTTYYPTPADVIPTSHYLKAAKFGQSTAWPLSYTGPGFFIFHTIGTTPAELANNVDNITYEPGMPQTKVFACLKVNRADIIDAVEVFSTSRSDQNAKRLTDDLDAGFVKLTSRLGHSEYRNVDKEATEALPENAGKLVYNYSLAVDAANNGATVIDAEASIKNGAHIIYMDTNNSTNDFHERQQFSVRGK